MHGSGNHTLQLSSVVAREVRVISVSVTFRKERALCISVVRRRNQMQHKKAITIH